MATSMLSTSFRCFMPEIWEQDDKWGPSQNNQTVENQFEPLRRRRAWSILLSNLLMTSGWRRQRWRHCPAVVGSRPRGTGRRWTPSCVSLGADRQWNNDGEVGTVTRWQRGRKWRSSSRRHLVTSRCDSRPDADCRSARRLSSTAPGYDRQRTCPTLCRPRSPKSGRTSRTACWTFQQSI